MTPDFLAAAVVGLFLQLVPVDQHWREAPEVVHARYRSFARVVALVAYDSRPLPDLDQARTALVLAGVAARESYLRADVMDCRVAGSGGARGAFQVESPKYHAEACAGWQSATELALRMLDESFRITKAAGLPLTEAAAFYCGGNGFLGERARWESRRRLGPAIKFPLLLPVEDPS